MDELEASSIYVNTKLMKKSSQPLPRLNSADILSSRRYTIALLLCSLPALQEFEISNKSEANFCCSESASTLDNSFEEEWDLSALKELWSPREMVPKELEISKNINLDNWKVITMLGEGAQSTVYLWKDMVTDYKFALKVWDKRKLKKHTKICCIYREMEVLESAKHPFIVELLGHFENEKYVWMALELWRAGDLFYHLKKLRKDEGKTFSEDTAKFYIACIILAIEKLHSEGVIYRDLKPENILINSDGYIKLCDMGLCIHQEGVNLKNCRQQRGSKEFFAPEIVRREMYDYNVDWWSLGILAYEIFEGHTPFCDDNVFMEQKSIRNSEVKFDKSNLSSDCKDFIMQLLDKSKHTRLGAGGVDEIKAHPWLNNVDWEGILNKEVVAPYDPKVEYMPDTHYFDSEFTKNKVLRHLTYFTK